MKKISDYIQYLLVISLVRLVGHVPRSFFFFCAPGVARILSLFPQMGKIARMNVRTAFPGKTKKECDRIAMKSLENLFISLCEFFWCKGKTEVVASLIELTDEVKATAAAGHASPVKGCIFVTPHLGNWEFAGITLASALKFPLGTVVRAARNPYLDKLVSSGRMVEGVQIIHSKGAVRAIHHALKEGRSLGILIDQNTRVRDGGAFVNFFGLPVPVSMTPAHFARKENRFVALGTTVREGRGFKPYLRPLPKPASEYASDEELTQALMEMSMDLIRQYPEQYLWMYRRFQNIPPDAPEDVKKRYPAYASVPGSKFFSSASKFRELEKREK